MIFFWSMIFSPEEMVTVTVYIVGAAEFQSFTLDTLIDPVAIALPPGWAVAGEDVKVPTVLPSLSIKQNVAVKVPELAWSLTTSTEVWRTAD